MLHHSTTNAAPSAPTIWRAMHLNVQTQETVMAAAIELQPSLLKRDATHIEQIENAVDIGAVLDLTPTASGLAEPMWYRRMQDFGPSAAGSIEDRLNGDWIRIHANHRTGIQERFIGALRWCGEEGVDALLRCWDFFNDYGRSLACVALGLLGAQRSGDHIWGFYQKVQNTSRENFFVGALWGLIDLQDHRAADAMASFQASLTKTNSCIEIQNVGKCLAIL